MTLIDTENYGLTKKSRTFTYDNILCLSVLYDKHKSLVLVYFAPYNVLNHALYVCPGPSRVAVLI